jgi:hypothetical protein
VEITEGVADLNVHARISESMVHAFDVPPAGLDERPIDLDERDVFNYFGFKQGNQCLPATSPQHNDSVESVSFGRTAQGFIEYPGIVCCVLQIVVQK